MDTTTRHGLRLLAELLSRAPTRDEVALVLGPAPAAGAPPEPVALDALAAELTSVFELGLRPRASIFLSANALLSDHPLDRLEDQLRLLASVGGEDARRVLDQHLLRWLPPLAAALARSPFVWPRALIHTLEALVVSIRLGLEGTAPAWALPPAPLDIGAEDTDLATISGWLCRPSACGLWLGRWDLARLGGDLPRGFGPRRRELTQLFRASSRFSTLPALIDAMDAMVADDAARLAGHPLAGDPRTRTLLAPWQERLAHARDRLAALRTQLPAPSPHAPSPHAPSPRSSSPHAPPPASDCEPPA